MRIHFNPIRLILAVSALLVSLASSGIAQEQPAEQQRTAATAQKGELRIPELASQEPNPESVRPKVPRECAGSKPDVQTHSSSATLSPALTSFLSSHNLSHKSYGDAHINTVFADSFKLRNCRVCYATLEVVVKHGAGTYQAGASDFSNDTITVGVAPFTPSTPPARFVSAQIWTATTPNPKTLTYALSPPAALSNHIFTGAGTPPAYLDIVAQDDTEIVSCKLSVWYY